MNLLKLCFATLMLMLFTSSTVQADLVWGFKSPAFHYGNGY